MALLVRKRRVPCHKAAEGASDAGRSLQPQGLCSLGFGPYSPPMNDRPNTEGKAALRRRLSAALRDNLKRRKAQAKGRATAKAESSLEKPHDSAGIVDDK
jgi:hypothetical protein